MPRRPRRYQIINLNFNFLLIFYFKGDVPYPDDCTKYIWCVNQASVGVMQCGAGQVFHETRCVNGNVNTCEPNMM